MNNKSAYDFKLFKCRSCSFKQDTFLFFTKGRDKVPRGVLVSSVVFCLPPWTPISLPDLVDKILQGFSLQNQLWTGLYSTHDPPYPAAYHHKLEMSAISPTPNHIDLLSILVEQVLVTHLWDICVSRNIICAVLKTLFSLSAGATRHSIHIPMRVTPSKWPSLAVPGKQAYPLQCAHPAIYLIVCLPVLPPKRVFVKLWRMSPTLCPPHQTQCLTCKGCSVILLTGWLTKCWVYKASLHLQPLLSI